MGVPRGSPEREGPQPLSAERGLGPGNTCQEHQPLFIVEVCLVRRAGSAADETRDWRPGAGALAAQSCVSLCDPVDCSPPGSSVHGILQARTLEWVAISFSKGSSQPGHRTWVSCIANHLILCCPSLLLPSTFPSITVFSNESVLSIKWPKY